MSLKGICLLLALVAVFQVPAATVSEVAARQRWPWNGLVDIDYTITGADTEGMAIAVNVTDVETGRVYTPTNFVEASRPTDAGRHRITWDTARDAVSLNATNLSVEVSLVRYEINPVRADLYCVIDLSGGSAAERWPVTYLAAVPEGGWTDEYKTTKLVLRRIKKGSISGLDHSTFVGFDSIEITSPYYIGVFEVTRAQYKLITGHEESICMNTDRKPQQGVSYDALRGICTGDSYYPSAETSVIGILRKKTGVACELPTARQWEYACRAGTTSWFNNGGSTESDLALVGRYRENQSDDKGGFANATTIVGCYLPNRWGLYDMHGNVEEWCLDGMRETFGDLIGVAGGRICKGGSFSLGGGLVHLLASWFLNEGTPAVAHGNQGFRLCINIE